MVREFLKGLKAMVGRKFGPRKLGSKELEQLLEKPILYVQLTKKGEGEPLLPISSNPHQNNAEIPHLSLGN